MRTTASRVRPWLSLVLAGLALVLAGVNAFPGQAYPVSTRATTSRVVLYIATLGPVWTVGFAAAGAALLVALWLRRARHWGHLPSVLVWTFYASALWTGAVGTGGAVAWPVTATAVVALHMVMLGAYVDEDARRRT